MSFNEFNQSQNQADQPTSQREAILEARIGELEKLGAIRSKRFRKLFAIGSTFAVVAIAGFAVLPRSGAAGAAALHANGNQPRPVDELVVRKELRVGRKTENHVVITPGEINLIRPDGTVHLELILHTGGTGDRTEIAMFPLKGGGKDSRLVHLHNPQGTEIQGQIKNFTPAKD